MMLIRRYTPPTCSLEIKAKSSALSRFSELEIIKDLRFKLSFDDPRQPDDQRFMIEGDGRALSKLSDAVISYVQGFLAEEVPLLYRDQDVMEEMGSGVIGDDVCLKSGGLLVHWLCLGSLATKETPAMIKLSALQLFDLATALDEYNAELVMLPTLAEGQSGRILSFMANPPGWARSVAMVVFSLGVTLVVMRVLQGEAPQLAVNDNPSPMARSSPGAPLPSVAPPLTDVEVVPPLVQSPTNEVAPAPANLKPSPIPEITAGSPEGVKSNDRIVIEVPSASNPSPFNGPDELPQIVVQERHSQSNPSPEKVEIAPGTKSGGGTDETAQKPLAIRTGPLSESAPKPPTIRTGPLSESAPKPPAIGIRPLSESAPKPPAIGTRPLADSFPSPPPIPSKPLADSFPSVPPVRSVTPLNGGGPVPLPSGAPLPSYNPPKIEVPNYESRRLFDTIPQVAEVRDYFKGKWKADSNINQILEYNLVLDSDGSVKQILPLGKAAETYIDRTGMPLVGEVFVSAIENGKSPIMRLVLKPDGQVEVFLLRI